ncbi:uncharacterized protein NECHADRAFT_35433 [Fusarium vanettenii 77-13-4]|uniref:Uncharacterized protein n=1 Tax=Fusarium vanettenii (strain ATCC MYA-4622 / CBS 123669 / FGSC 9596 / NRRL 45880 / 77-13-4) TaxID=660122 RepID=C7YN65_FUSV7|nr:uncharacterized protein NECHADRAFT_35433 [Fusarium vanettenii 77-13-4]EEU47568.1 hypothetical protein NECHADRAFT_35433 [Fusarium vanettenii 77-13-4]
MAMDPRFAVFEYDLYTRVLQREAIGELMCLTPWEKKVRLFSYGLPPSCEAVVKAYNPLLSWSSSNNAVIKDITQPFFHPEAFRLEAGCTIWPSPDTIGLLMPLGAYKAPIELLPRGTDYVITAYWHADTVLFLNEMGMRFTGNGSVRFIYIMLYKLAVPQIRGWEVYVP